MLLGCAAAAVAVLVLVAGAIALIVFLESGADDGDVALEAVGAYPPGSFQRFAEHGFYVVSFRGEILALSDLDAANRAAEGRRCRVAPLAASDPNLREALDRYGASISPLAAGTTLVFHEECNGALYDAAGVRLDAEGRNLDRFRVSVDDADRLVVHTAERTCSERTANSTAAPSRCNE